MRQGIIKMDRGVLWKVLRILAVISLVILLSTLIIVPKSNCDACRFRVNDEKYTINSFLRAYSGDCFKERNPYLENFTEIILYQEPVLESRGV